MSARKRALMCRTSGVFGGTVDIPVVGLSPSGAVTPGRRSRRQSLAAEYELRSSNLELAGSGTDTQVPVPAHSMVCTVHTSMLLW